MSGTVATQRGLALIGALLITVVAVAIAASVGMRSLHDIAASTRAAEALAAGEVFADIEAQSQAILRADAARAQSDSLDEDWATTAISGTADAARGSARLSDLQGRFNLNALAFDPGNAGAGGGRRGASEATAPLPDETTAAAPTASTGMSVAAVPAGTSGTPTAAADPGSGTETGATVAAPGTPPPGMKLVEREYKTGTGDTTRYYDAVADGSAGASAGTTGAGGAGAGDGSGAAGDPDAARSAATGVLAAVPALAAALGETAGASAGGAAPVPRELSPQQVAIARFAVLLEALHLDPALVPALLDWLDADGDARFPNGAEDDYYMELDPPYRAANRRFAAVEELRLVRGVDAEVYARLAPFVTVLPGAGEINVNTAPVEVLMSLSPALDASTAAQIVNARETQPFQSVDQFLALPVLHGRPLLADGLTTRSAFFSVAMDVTSGRSALVATSVLVRHEPRRIDVLSRARGFFDD